METPPTAAAAKELLVTGVSRSGRVRKKSSKLLDFQSPDELEKKPKRGPKPQRSAGRGRLSSIGARGRKTDESDATDDIAVDEDIQDETETEGDVDEQFEKPPILKPYADANSDDEIDELVADLVEGVEAESMGNADNIESKVRSSLYMTEKANKRKILKDGKVVTGKLERKDKGKSRYTAYSMWAREFRKTSKFSKNQDLDFSNAARRLGELWANVSNKEKNIWRRKAKIQATKARASEKAVAPPPPPPANNGAFFNRPTTSRTKKLAAERLKSPPVEKLDEPVPSSSKRRRTTTPKKLLSTAGLSTSGTGVNTAGTSRNMHSSVNSSPKTDKTSFCNTSTINAAAHLKLLGESLTVIGERLKEHEGQIAVSGSLSVLLDSLLCSMGPLMCLTTYLPGMENREDLKRNLEATLDNIAYIMPGL